MSTKLTPKAVKPAKAGTKDLPVKGAGITGGGTGAKQFIVC